MFSLSNVRPETALPVAKRRLEEDYSVVGLNEDLLGFFQLLEVMFPSFFRGAPEIYKENGNYFSVNILFRNRQNNQRNGLFKGRDATGLQRNHFTPVTFHHSQPSLSTSENV